MAISVSIRVFHDIGDTPSDNSAAQAGCSATCISYYSGTKTYTGGHPRPGESGGTTSVAYTNYQLTATPATGWYFKGWDVITRNYVTGGLDSQGNVRTDVEIQTERTYHSGTNPYPANTTATDYEFPGDLAEANPGYDWRRHTFKWEIIAVYAQFEQGTPPPPTYTITTAVSPSGAGTATGGGTFNSGASCTLTATPASGYSFVRWEKNGVQVSTSSSYTFTVSESATYTAIFESATPLVHIQVVAFNDFYVTLNGISGTTSSAWTVVEGDFPLGDTITITASTPDPILNPFKAWYLNPSGWGSPEQTGTLVPGAGATYTFTASANATYFATFNYPVVIEIRTENDYGAGEAPDAVVSINGQSSGGNRFNLPVVPGSSATVGTTEYGGVIIDDPILGMYRLYFMGWIDRSADPSSSAIISTALQYAFQATQSYRYYFIASYRPFLKLTTAIMPNAACGIISTSPTGRDGEWFEAWTGVTLTAMPSNGYRFVKWTAWESWPGGSEYEYEISTNTQISIAVQDYYDTTIRAYFEWDGTDLLVNSANLGSPVQLVYDPATNKLIADY